MSWFDDVTGIGVDLLDDVGEGLGSLVQNATTAKPAADKAANPATHQQPSQTVVDENGNAVTLGFGEKWTTDNKPVVYGGIALAVLLVLVLLVLAVRK